MYKPTQQDITELQTAIGKAVLEFNRFELVTSICLEVANPKIPQYQLRDLTPITLSGIKIMMGTLTRRLIKENQFGDTMEYHIYELAYSRNWVVHNLPMGAYIFISSRDEFRRLINRINHASESSKFIRTQLSRWITSGRHVKRFSLLPVEMKQALLSLEVMQ